MEVIYGLIDPRTLQLRYVGKSKDLSRRMEKHIREARRGSRLHSRLWIASVLAAGMKPETVVIETCVGGANEAERFWIEYFRAIGCDLTNISPGGDGQPKGYSPSAETRARISRAVRGRKHSPAALANIAAASNTEEMRARRRANHKKLMETNPEWLAKTRAGMLGKKMSESAKAKIAASWTPERKKAHAEKQRKREVSPVWLEQLSAALKARWDRYRARRTAA